MKLSTAKTNAIHINNLPHCTMTHNIYYVKSLRCTIARSPVNPVDIDPRQKRGTLAPLPLPRCRGGGRAKFFGNLTGDIK
jgi:hypothetical protein